MGVVGSIDIDPTKVTKVRASGHTIFVEDDDATQAISISGKDHGALREFVEQLADAVGDLARFREEEMRAQEQAAYDEAVGW